MRRTSLKWVKYKVLPYIDLRFACEVDDVEIEDEILAPYFFPATTEGDAWDQLQGTKWYAEQLLNDVTLSLVSVQANLALQQRK